MDSTSFNEGGSSENHIIDEKSIMPFIESVENYFTTITDKKVKVGTPFLVEETSNHIFDYTGVIAISGDYCGVVKFTAPHVMLTHLMSCLGVLTSQDEKLMDLVGEVSNTISGNVRRAFGQKFMLSVPVVFKGVLKFEDSGFVRSGLDRSVVIPILWNYKQANLITNIY